MIKKLFLSLLITLIWLVSSSTKIYAEDLIWSYGPASINNINGFIVDYVSNKQVYFSFIPGHSYRLDIFGAVNPNTFWIGICDDTDRCNSSAANYPNDGNFSVSFVNDTNAQWFDIWGNCAGFGVCSITGAELYDTTPPPTPTPVTKTFVVPGFGASWNAGAFANCQFDNNPANWSLASYAEDVYNPLLTALAPYWTAIPFYYDWRQNITTNALTLSDAIDANVVNGEKVNLVGHSMGGLVGRQYLENSSGSKLNKFLTAGSPHMGVPTSYAAWGGGEIWEDNWIYKIAMTLFLNHCGGFISNPRVTIQTNFPSIGNLLPIFDYLKKNAKTFIPWTKMFAQNTWHSNNNFDSHGVDTETTNGTGFATLKEITVKPPSKSDIKAGNWLDGKPSGKIYSIDGDGTVLANATKLPGVPGVTIDNENHSGIVNSSAGMGEILRFLGIAPSIPPSATSIQPNSALILIGYPGNFWVTDRNGNVLKDSHGMVSIMNPKSGSLKLNLIPQTTNTLFIVAQFLPNGRTLYKEYNLSGANPKSKTIDFSLENPQEDILK